MALLDVAAHDINHRRKRLRLWIDVNFEGSQIRFIEDCAAHGFEINQGELSGLLNKKSFGEKKARALELIARMAPKWLDNTTPATFKAVENTLSGLPHTANEATAPAYDVWTTEVIRMMQALKPGQREGALAALRTHIQHLGPPRVGQAVHMADHPTAQAA